MEIIKQKNLQQVIFAITCVFSFSLLRSRGEVDIEAWLLWINNISEHGLINGYIANKDMYPPFTNVIFSLVLKFSALTNISVLVSLKLFIFGSLLITSLIFLAWTKNWLLAIAVQAGFTLNAMALSYIDIFIAPFLLISLYALYNRNFLLFTIFYFINVMIKWQGIIILPFILLYILNISSLKEIKNIIWGKIASQIVLPSVVLVVFVFMIFGREVYDTFDRAMKEDMLSGYALNLSWIITRIVYFLNPEANFFEYGIMKIIYIKSGEISYFTKFIFFVFFFSTLIACFKEKKSFINLLKFSVIGYLIYFAFNTCVHENHLFLASLLSLLILNYDSKFLTEAIGIMLAFNINMFLFYGTLGDQPYIHGYFGAEISVILSALFIIFFMMIYLPVLNILIKNFVKPKPIKT